MCTVVVSLVPQDQVPLLLLGVRDELTGRPWRPPARHWPGSPLIGGIDEQAGGTWLAVHPGLPRVACVLNGRGQFAPAEARRSRGELPLRAAGDGPGVLRELAGDREALSRFDPFHLVCADLAGALLLSWDGQQVALAPLVPGTHVLTNAGHMYAPDGTGPGVDTRTGQEDAKAARFGPKFAAVRPSGDPDAPVKDAWGDWLTLAGGDGLPRTDPAAIIAGRELPDGRLWGSTSVSMVALARDGRLRYDFQPVPADPATWYEVGTAS